jgi:RES domain-containing protein
MIVYRLSGEKYKNDLSGRGAERAGGRWNSKGVAMLYTCQSRALCTTEIAVHTPLGIVPSNYWLTTIEIPDATQILEIDIASLPKDWKSFPHPHSTQVIGDNFVSANEYLIMKVPSAVVQGDFNYLVNPAHSLSQSLKIKSTELFEFDERLFIK